MATNKSTARKPAAPKALPKAKPEATRPTVKLPERKLQQFAMWIVGDMPLITHAWSLKAKMAMLSDQLKETKAGKEPRDPEQDFLDSLYIMPDEKSYGFPATGVKNAIISAAHKDKGMERTTLKAALWINAELVRARPAKAGAICDLPLLKIFGPSPQMREDMVRVGTGMSKKATFAYRGQFSRWAFQLKGVLNTSACPLEWLAHCIRDSGMSCGIGEWRQEKSGMFGAYHLASQEEERAWTLYKHGKGPLPEAASPFGEFDFSDETELRELEDAAE